MELELGGKQMAAHRHVVRTTVVALLASLVVACSSSSGPSDTTIDLDVDEISSPTNQIMPAVTGTTDAGATVTVTSPVDTTSEVASGAGAFSVSIMLDANSVNELTIHARDPAGNETSTTEQVVHDGIAPTILVNTPQQGGITAGQSGFQILVVYSDAGSGIDESTLSITNGLDVGGVYQQDGSFSTTYAAASSLVPIFSVTGDSASTVVADSLAFQANTNILSAQVGDLAGNTSSLVARTFDVTADPPSLVVTDASGSAGSTGLPIVIAVANADTVSGVQLDFSFDTLVIASVDSVTTTGRANSFDSTPFNEISRGLVRVLLFDNGGDSVSPGQGPVLNLWVTLDASAASGDHTLSADDVVLSDPVGGTVTGLGPFSGTLTVP
jgi:hypothetical protein